MMLTIGLSYISFIMLRYIPSITSLIRAFIMKVCCILLKAFSVTIELYHVIFAFASVNMLYYFE
jgi:hypothetical protein